MANKLDIDYIKLIFDVLELGVDKNDRTGTGTRSIFGATIRHKMSDGFPILTTKKVAFKTMVTELKWFLKGDTNIKYLVDNGCNIWNGDAYKNYMDEFRIACPKCPEETQEEFIDKIKTNDEFAEKWGELGRIYGAQWRSWGGVEQFDNHAETVFVDQIANLIRNIKANPDSRRLMVSAWNPSEVNQVVLPPCHYSFQCYVANGKLSLMWNQRSADLFLGVPFNISSYGLLLHLLCKETGYVPGELIGNFGDIHLYKNHIEQAKEQTTRDIYDLPEIDLICYDIYQGDFDAKLVNYNSNPTLKAPLSN